MTLRTARCSPVWLLCIGLVFSTPAVADADASAPVSLEQAINAALRGNPGLRSFGFQLLAQRAQRDAAALRPAPELELELENFLGTGEYRGADALEATLALSQVVELGGKRQARISAAEAGLGLVDVERQAAQLDVLAEVTRRFIDAAALQERVQLSDRAIALAEETVSATERRVNAGRSPDSELFRARVTLDRARLGSRRIRADLQSAYRLLAATWGAAEPSIDGAPFSEVRANLLALPPVPEYAGLQSRLEANPDFLRFASEARLRDAELRLASSLRKPDLTLAGGIRRFQDTRDEALVAYVSVPLFADRNAQAQITAARAGLDQVQSNRQAALTAAQAALYQLHQALSAAVLEVRTLERDILPLADQALRETRYAHERGRYSYVELADAQREFLDLQLALIDSAADAHRLRVEIERLSNAPLDNDVP